MEHKVEYPKKIFHRDGRVKRVTSVTEHAQYSISEGWAESPAGPFFTPEPPEMESVEPAPAPAVPDAPTTPRRRRGRKQS